MKEIRWEIPVKTVSEANSREHWHVKARRHTSQAFYIKSFFRKELPQFEFPLRIRLTRLGKRKLDSDNLQMSMKWIRDAIADNIFPNMAAGRADDDPRLIWEYDQMTGKMCGVLIQFFFQNNS